MEWHENKRMLNEHDTKTDDTTDQTIDDGDEKKPCHHVTSIVWSYNILLQSFTLKQFILRTFPTHIIGLD